MQGSGAFDHDLGIDGFPEDALDAVLERHLRVGAGAASAAETEEDGFSGDGDDFEIAAVGLEHSPEFFKFFSDCLFHDVCLSSGGCARCVGAAVRRLLLKYDIK